MEFLMKIIKVHLWSLFNSKNLIFSILSLLLIFSCSKKETYIKISDSEMIKILTKIYILESKSKFNNLQSFGRQEKFLGTYYPLIFDSTNYSIEDFEKNLINCIENPNKFDMILDSVLIKIKQTNIKL
ncbi:MAG: hypothetical protein CMD07_00605 [Flavobacteriales bacterium]|nr:hypothetical protein [Flavobacteriales bacterium]